jgi:uncharacterized protein YijF (DUF1287 family)
MRRAASKLAGALLLAAVGLAWPAAAEAPDMAARLVAAALDRTKAAVVYDPTYFRIPYPMGDVPADKGVCTDEVIRSYRALGVDLQRLVHEDMARAFAKYPRRWGLARTDTNIDHRRVPNLRVFFSRHGVSLPVSSRAADYRAGDIVTWDLLGDAADFSSLADGRLPHIGILTDQRSADGARPLVVHNIGQGPRLEDILFRYKITGHYRYLPETAGR